jgi:hypothetical protein
MTIRFAAAWNGTTPAIARSIAIGAPLGAANDNAPRNRLHAVVPEADDEDGADARLADALMHFARHGLSAASTARAQAEAAHASGDTEASARWLDICHRLDRRMAAAAAKGLREG